jgi:hypothetical protein
MNRKVMTLAIMAFITSFSARGEAAVVSSSKTFNYSVSTPFNIFSHRNNGITSLPSKLYENAMQIVAGVASAAAVVDTSTGMGRFEEMQLSPFVLNPTSVTSQTSTTVTGVIGTFPNPPHLQTITGTWTETISIDGISGAPPTLLPTNPRSLETNSYHQPWYTTVFDSGLDASSFTIHGTYQVTGPLTGRTVPWSVEFESLINSDFLQLGVKGVASFAEGFRFEPLLAWQGYTTNNKPIFEGSVDGLFFTATFSPVASGFDLHFSQVTVPEPSTGIIAPIMAAIAWAAARRRGRSSA